MITIKLCQGEGDWYEGKQLTCRGEEVDLQLLGSDVELTFNAQDITEIYVSEHDEG